MAAGCFILFSSCCTDGRRHYCLCTMGAPAPSLSCVPQVFVAASSCNFSSYHRPPWMFFLDEESYCENDSQLLSRLDNNGLSGKWLGLGSPGVEPATKLTLIPRNSSACRSRWKILPHLLFSRISPVTLLSWSHYFSRDYLRGHIFTPKVVLVLASAADFLYNTNGNYFPTWVVGRMRDPALHDRSRSARFDSLREFRGEAWRA